MIKFRTNLDLPQNTITNLDLPQNTITVWITLRQLKRGHQKGGKFGKQVIKKIVLELFGTKFNENFMYSLSTTSSALKLDTMKKC